MESVYKHSIYDDPVAYDLIHNQDTGDLSFYISQIGRSEARVLELGCGTGRLTIPLALKGLNVTGIDIQDGMLAVAGEKSLRSKANINWVHGDARCFNFDQPFDAILFPANSISHLLDNESIDACLSSVRRHLTSEGRFIFQAFNLLFSVLMRDPGQRYPVAEYQDPYGKGLVTVTETSAYDRALQVNIVKWYYSFEDNSNEIVKTMPLRMIFPQELDYLLHHNGFDIIAKYGGFDCSAFSSESIHQILVCQKSKK